MRGLALLFVAACSAVQGVGQQEAAELVDHTCKASTLPTTCGVPPDELPCCAVQTAAGEEQINCCPAGGVFVHRLCADGTPKCASGRYPDTCQGLSCPS